MKTYYVVTDLGIEPTEGTEASLKELIESDTPVFLSLDKALLFAVNVLCVRLAELEKRVLK